MRTSATSSKLARQTDARLLADELGDWSRGTGAVHRQLARAIALAIDRGVLMSGRRLPSERVLATTVSVSRGTAVAAYDVLVADDRIQRRRGSGTFVTGELPALPEGREGSTLVHRLVDASTTPGDAPSMIDLSLSVLHDASAVRPFTLTAAELQGLDPPTGYSPWGLRSLRDAIADHVTGWGLATTADQIVVTGGAQQAIAVAAACWVRPGDTVVVDDPTYPGAVASFVQAGARLAGVPLDARGLDPNALAAALADRPALVYLQPTVHSPTGITARGARRQAIADVVSEARVPMVEDLALVDLSWGRTPPPITAVAPGVTSLVVGSLGKRFWGGLRLGFVRAPVSLARRAARIKATQDLGTSMVSQLVGEHQMRTSGELDRIALVAGLRQRYDVLATALRRVVPSWTWEEPTGGLSLWARLPGADGASFARAAFAHGVAVASPEPLCVGDGHRDHIRISFAAPPDDLEEGAARLGAAWASHHA